jgi:hypothetical protein
MTIRAAVFAFLDQQSRPRRWSRDFIIVVIEGRSGRLNLNERQLFRYMHEYANISGATFRCTDRVRGYYDFTPGVKVGKAIVD